MSRTTQQQFTLSLGQPGTALALYVVDGIETEFELSNVCNPLSDMLVALTSLITNPVQLWEGTNTAAFTWYSDKESYNWTLTARQDGTLQVHVTQSCEFFGDDEVEVVACECTLTDFVLCVTMELDRFIKSVGLLNYNQQWQTGEFPLTYFLILKKHLIDQGIWTAAQGNDGGTLEDEMKLIIS